MSRKKLTLALGISFLFLGLIVFNFRVVETIASEDNHKANGLKERIAFGQQVFFQPVELYRFRVSNTNLGYFLTPNYSEGINNGYAPDGVAGFIFVPEFGFEPTNPGLQPVKAWRVSENGRIYYYYSAFPQTISDPNYTLLGTLGYMYSYGQNQVTVPILGGGNQNFPFIQGKKLL